MSTPGPPRIDPVTRNELPGLSLVQPTRAFLQARLVDPVELGARQQTAVGYYDLYVPAWVRLTSQSTVEAYGEQYTVKGVVAAFPVGRPRFRYCQLKLVSDLQRQEG